MITNTQSQVGADNHLVQHSLSAVFSRGHSSASSSLGKSCPRIFAVVRVSRNGARGEKKSPAWRSGRREMERTVEEAAEPGERLLGSRVPDCGKGEGGGRARRAHLTPKHHRLHSPDRPMIRRVKRRVGLFDALHAPCVRVR